MERSVRNLALCAVFVATALTAVGALILSDGASSGANNPPSTLLGTVAVDPTDDPAATTPTPVWAIAEANGRYYIGGNFTEVGGESQPWLAAIEVATGRLDPAFRPVLANNGGGAEVLSLALSPDGNDLYIGGRFKSVDGTTRNRLAKLDARTGALDTAFNPNASAVVETIVVDGSGVYVGGAFDGIGGGTNSHLAKLNPTTGALDATFAPVIDGTVLDLEFVGSDLFVGGNFQNVNGVAHPYLVRLDTSDGTVSAAWNTDLPVPAKVLALSVRPDGSMVYAGVAGTASQLGNTVWAYTTAGTRTWQKVGAGDVQAIEATDDTVYVGSHGEWVFTEAKFLLDGVTDNPDFPENGYVEDPSNTNAVKREKFHSLDPDTGDLNPWDPDADAFNGVWELELGASGLLAGGDFTEIVNPTGTPGANDTIFTPHVAVFPNIGSLDAAPEPVFSIDCAGTSCNVDASASSDDGGTIASYEWEFGNGQTASGVSASVLYADDATYTVRLTVADPGGQSASTTKAVAIGNGGLPIEHVDTSSLNQSSGSFTQQLPPTGAAGDVAVAFMSVKDLASTPTAPDGWTQAGFAQDGELHTTIWTKAIGAGEPGTNVTFTLTPATKADLTISVFRGVDGTAPIEAIDVVQETKLRVGHRSPEIPVATDSVVLHFWSQRSSETTEFTSPGSEIPLSTSFGQGGGRIATALSVVPNQVSATAPGAVAVAEHHSLAALGWTIALRPGLGGTTCNGQIVTVDIGLGESPTNGDDVILGTPNDDVINGIAGNDTICGLGGDDTINGGGGSDIIYGGDGNDILGGQGGADQLYGEGDDDTINGGVGNDTLVGGPGDDDLRGQGNADMMDGGPGIDQFFGGSGNDTILTGDGGNLGSGQVVRGGGNNDTITGSSADDDLEGGSGLDQIYGLAGNDRLRGGNARDELFGGDGNDILEGGATTDILRGGDGNDTIFGGTGDDQLFGESGDDTLNGQGDSDICDGGTTGEVVGDSAQLCEVEADVP